MRLTQLRQADLNLLVVFAVLAEERSVSRAARRLLLSQPAVSRALARLRDTFHDDLLVRTGSGFELTPHGRRLLTELEVMLPRLDRLLSGGSFDPAREEAHFRIAATDYASHILCPLLSRVVLPRAGKITFDLTPLREDSFDYLERGGLDLVLNADDGNTPARFATEVLFVEEFVCVVARDSRYRRRISLEQYVAAQHVGVTILGRMQMIVEKQLAALGHKHRYAMKVPYFSVGIRIVAGTQLIATVPRRLAEYEAHNPALKQVHPPAGITGFKYIMVWHPRLESDASHGWLRATLRELGKGLSRPA